MERAANGADTSIHLTHTCTFLENQKDIIDTKDKVKENRLNEQSTFKSYEVSGPSGLSKTKSMIKNDAKPWEN